MQQERSLLFVFLRQNVMLVVETVERLREFERVARHERRLLRGDRLVGIRESSEPASNNEFPQIVAAGRGKNRGVTSRSTTRLSLLQVCALNVGRFKLLRSHSFARFR